MHSKENAIIVEMLFMKRNNSQRLLSDLNGLEEDFYSLWTLCGSFLKFAVTLLLLSSENGIMCTVPVRRDIFFILFNLISFSFICKMRLNKRHSYKVASQNNIKSRYELISL